LIQPARIGEWEASTLEDYRVSAQEVTIKEAKGKQPRTLPISLGTAEAVMPG